MPRSPDHPGIERRFLIPPSLNTCVALQKSGFQRKSVVAYIIRNGRLRMEWSEVDRATLPIAEKAVSTMINYNGVGDLYRIDLVTQRADAAFNPRL
jgi:hypothetical protein